MADLVVRESWFVRALRAVRLLTPVPSDEHDAGLDFGGAPASPTMKPIDSMSAMAAFPYVAAAVRVIASDMASIPILVSRTLSDGSEEQYEAHPLLDLLERPNSGTTGTLFRRQLWTDYLLTGNAYARIIRDRGGMGAPISLVRLHPERIQIETDRLGMIASYVYDDHAGGYGISPNDVIHIRGASWEDGKKGLFGMGAILPLKDELEADQSLQRANRKNFDAGRPTLVVSPKDTNARLDARQVAEASAAINARLNQSRGGAVVLSGAFEMEDLGWTPKDMEGAEQRDWVRRSVMAVLHVPPIKLGLETANYATAQEQLRDYWTTYSKEASLFDAALTQLAREMGQGGDVARHHFADVPALQEDRGARLSRVTEWVVLGASPNEAAAYEGFTDAPDLESIPAPDTMPAGGSEQPGEDDPEDEAPALRVVRSKGPTLESWWFRSAQPKTRQQRLAIWRAFEDDLRGPEERATAKVMRRFWGQQRTRYVRRLAALERARGIHGAKVRSLEEDLIREILDSGAEMALLKEAVDGQIARMLKRAFQLTARRMEQQGVEWDPATASDLKIAETLAANVQSTTDAKVAKILQDGIREGRSVTDMATEIRMSAAFSPARALTVARTEATKAVNAGSLEAMRTAAVEHNLVIEKVWISSGDEHVRDEHAALDGTTVGIDEAFSMAITVGRKGEETDRVVHAGHPGDFSDPRMDANCRCTIIPRIVGE